MFNHATLVNPIARLESKVRNQPLHRTLTPSPSSQNHTFFVMSESGRSSVVSDGSENPTVAGNPMDSLPSIQELMNQMMSVGLRRVGYG